MVTFILDFHCQEVINVSKIKQNTQYAIEYKHAHHATGRNTRRGFQMYLNTLANSQFLILEVNKALAFVVEKTWSDHGVHALFTRFMNGFNLKMFTLNIILKNTKI